MDKERIQRAEAFLKETFAASPYLQTHPEEYAYRLEHSYRVANIGREIAEAEGFPVSEMVIACLLHDIAYCQEMPGWEVRKNHGRASAQMVRPFLEALGIPEERRMDMLYGIAIHVDDGADFAWRRTAFAESIADADNIDRFDVYRIYETLDSVNFRNLSLAEKQQRVASMLDQLRKLQELPTATKTAQRLWRDRLDFYISFYERLQRQLTHSDALQDTP